MKTTVNFCDFLDAFQIRKENFSYEGKRALFDYLEEMEQSTGEEMELDVIALCCEYSEDTYQSIAENYRIDLSDCNDDSDIEDAVREYLGNKTVIVGEVSGGFVYAIF
jgi:trehalose/maltose hydrolase-like predicted phosphorylase